MYSGTDFYGINEIFMNYAGLPGYIPLPVAVQHGWQYQPTTFEIDSNPPEIWIWSERMADLYSQKFPNHRVRVIGSFFCYICNELKGRLPIVEKKGSIVIPNHSTHHIGVKYSAEEYAKLLNNLDEKYKPISVLLYYLDLNESTIQAYTKYGFDIRCNGSLYDSKFLYNFINNVYDKEYFITPGDFGSATFYAMYLGLKPYIFGPISSYYGSGAIYKRDIARIKASENDELGLLRHINNNLNMDTVNQELGVDYLLPKKELREIILKNYTPKVVCTILKRKIYKLFMSK